MTRDSYDAAARSYAEHLAGELAQKPLDRHLLNRFAEATRGRGLVADLGCGPGHVARYLSEQGVSTIGIDLSPEMIRLATEQNPGLDFRTGDMLSLPFDDASLAGAIAFYSIVHFDLGEVERAALEIRRVLKPQALALIAFHAGDQVVHVDDLFGVPVSLDFRFFIPSDVIHALGTARLRVIEEVQREPYEGAEYQSRRCYLVAMAE